MPLGESRGNFLRACRAVTQAAGDLEPEVCREEVLSGAEARSQAYPHIEARAPFVHCIY